MPATPDVTRERLAARRESLRTNGGPTSRPEVDKPLIDSMPTQDAAKPAPTYRAGMLVKPLTGFYETVGGFVVLADQVCGQAIIESAAGAAESLDELARTNPKVRKVLMKLMESSAITKVIVAHLPITLAVTAHHFPKALSFLAQILSNGPMRPADSRD